MIQSMPDNVGVASGTTMVFANPSDKGWDYLWAKLQGIDWTYFMGLLNVISYAGVPATAVGNNMIVRKKAYWETGGYANIRFSITEDYKLYSEICAKGYGWNNVMFPDVLAHSVETKGFTALLHQRKRWLSGGKELPWYWWLLFGVFLFFYYGAPIVSMALAFGFGDCNNPVMDKIQLVCGFIWGVKWILQVIQINRICQNVGEPKPSVWWHLIYEIYLLVVTIGTSIFFVIPKKTVWKGRKY
jgi:cellulose synthase/poly-beta-1,6-N-acetylglucosamine synthase-like glycosyltransferase